MIRCCNDHGVDILVAEDIVIVDGKRGSPGAAIANFIEPGLINVTSGDEFGVTRLIKGSEQGAHAAPAANRAYSDSIVCPEGAGGAECGQAGREQEVPTVRFHVFGSNV